MIWEAIQTVAIVYCVVQLSRHFHAHHTARNDGCRHYVRTNAPGFPCEDCGARIDGEAS